MYEDKQYEEDNDESTTKPSSSFLPLLPPHALPPKPLTARTSRDAFDKLCERNSRHVGEITHLLAQKQDLDLKSLDLNRKSSNDNSNNDNNGVETNDFVDGHGKSIRFKTRGKKNKQTGQRPRSKSNKGRNKVEPLMDRSNTFSGLSQKSKTVNKMTHSASKLSLFENDNDDNDDHNQNEGMELESSFSDLSDELHASYSVKFPNLANSRPWSARSRTKSSRGTRVLKRTGSRHTITEFMETRIGDVKDIYTSDFFAHLREQIRKRLEIVRMEKGREC